MGTKRKIKDIHRKTGIPAITLQGSVTTPDGPGIVVKITMRKNTNGGPGCRQFRVQLETGQIRHYNATEISKLI